MEWNRIVNPSFFFDARASTFAYNWPNAGSWTVPKRTGIILLKNNLAPRVGVAYDLQGTGRTVVKANWGRESE